MAAAGWRLLVVTESVFTSDDKSQNLKALLSVIATHPLCRAIFATSLGEPRNRAFYTRARSTDSTSCASSNDTGPAATSAVDGGPTDLWTIRYPDSLENAQLLPFLGYDIYFLRVPQDKLLPALVRYLVQSVSAERLVNY